MSDWQVGDLAVCVKGGEIRCPNCLHKGGDVPRHGKAVEVVHIGASIIGYGPGAGFPCGCVCLYLADGTCGVSQRFRKIRPDEHEACEEEFRILLKLSKQRVSA